MLSDKVTLCNLNEITKVIITIRITFYYSIDACSHMKEAMNCMNSGYLTDTSFLNSETMNWEENRGAI